MYYSMISIQCYYLVSNCFVVFTLMPQLSKSFCTNCCISLISLICLPSIVSKAFFKAIWFFPFYKISLVRAPNFLQFYICAKILANEPKPGVNFINRLTPYFWETFTLCMDPLIRKVNSKPWSTVMTQLKGWT